MQELLENYLKIAIKPEKFRGFAVSVDTAEKPFLLHPAFLDEQLRKQLCRDCSRHFRVNPLARKTIYNWRWMSDDKGYLLRREDQGSASRVARQCGPSMGSLRNSLIAPVRDSSTKAYGAFFRNI